ncbi:MAG: hypothetical protein HY074_17985 [Deltaproteobacteria bacterium]|nr:hypothetical protein [Deltaproteobacteria bacterium]
MKLAKTFLLVLALVPGSAMANPVIPGNALGQVACTFDAAVSSYSKNLHNNFIEHLGPSSGPYGYPLEGFLLGDGKGSTLLFSNDAGIQAAVDFSGTPSNATIHIVISKQTPAGQVVFSQNKTATAVASQGASFRLPVDEIIQDDQNFLRRITSLEVNCMVVSYVNPAAPTTVLAGQITNGVTSANNMGDRAVANLDAAKQVVQAAPAAQVAPVAQALPAAQAAPAAPAASASLPSSK